MTTTKQRLIKEFDELEVRFNDEDGQIVEPLFASLNEEAEGVIKKWLIRALDTIEQETLERVREKFVEIAVENENVEQDWKASMLYVKTLKYLDGLKTKHTKG